MISLVFHNACIGMPSIFSFYQSWIKKIQWKKIILPGNRTRIGCIKGENSTATLRLRIVTTQKFAYINLWFNSCATVVYRRLIHYKLESNLIRALSNSLSTAFSLPFPAWTSDRLFFHFPLLDVWIKKHLTGFLVAQWKTSSVGASKL